MAISDQVIVVDDDEAVRESLDALFSARDYSVRAFGSASSLMRALPSLSPSCIVIDVWMAKMDGITLLRRLRKKMGTDWPVIVIGGSDAPIEVDRVLEAGAFAVLAKPFTPARLVALVAQAPLKLSSKHSPLSGTS